MRGPHYLAITLSDDVDCGGAHPDMEAQALVYDLSTGLPVGWSKLLPKTLVQSTSLDTAGDATKLGLVASPILSTFYRKAAALQGRDPACKDALDEASLSFLLRPDAEHAGLGLEPFGLPHAIAACGPAVTIPLAALGKFALAPQLSDAVAAAHAARSYGFGPR